MVHYLKKSISRYEVIIMEHEELEIFEFTEEERANWIEMLVKENMREKVVTYDPEVLKRINTVQRHLKLLLEQDNCDYTMSFEGKSRTLCKL